MDFEKSMAIRKEILRILETKTEFVKSTMSSMDHYSTEIHFTQGDESFIDELAKLFDRKEFELVDKKLRNYRYMRIETEYQHLLHIIQENWECEYKFADCATEIPAWCSGLAIINFDWDAAIGIINQACVTIRLN